MARPQKLSDREWEEIGRRYANGESSRALAKIYPVSESAIRKRYGAQCAEIRDAAMALVSAETRIERMPVSAQGIVRSLADQMKGIQNDLAEAAANGALVAKRMTQIAAQRVQSLDATCEPDDMRPVVAAMETANKAATMGMGILQANKGKSGDAASSLEDLVTGAGL